MAEGKWTNAILDEHGVLVGYEVVTDELLHVRSANRYPWPNNEPDLAPKRYQLRRDTINGKEAFWPIVHVKDAAEENIEKLLSEMTDDDKARIAAALLEAFKGTKQ